MTGLRGAATASGQNTVDNGSVCACRYCLTRSKGDLVTVTETIIEERLVRSQHRVKSYGEVFTPRHMVDRMLDLVREELETGPDFVDKTFLEPSAGDGNFLSAILRRKLLAIESRYPTLDWPRESLFALASIYGVELLVDNHQDAKATMFAEFLGFHQAHGIACGPRTNLHRAAAYLIDMNIVCGDTLTGKTASGQNIHFSWWHRIDDQAGLVQREPFTLASLRHGHGFDFTTFDTYQPCGIDRVHEKAGDNV